MVWIVQFSFVAALEILLVGWRRNQRFFIFDLIGDVVGILRKT